MGDSINILKATVLDIKAKKDTRKWINKSIIYAIDDLKDSTKAPAPTLITSNFFSYFNLLTEEVDKEGYKANAGDDIETHQFSKILGDCSFLTTEQIKEKRKAVKTNIDNTRKRIEQNINFLMNSSIWIRFCDNGNWDAINNETQTQEIKDALDEFDWFKKLELYNFKPAKEYIEYQIRAQSDNYLAEIGGHGVHITPMIYSNEVEFRDFFLDKEEKSKLWFKLLGTEESCKSGFKTKDVDLRILLVDDKIGNCDKEESRRRIHETYDCNNCCSFSDCKLRVIRSLLRGDFIKNEEKQDLFKQKTYWAEKNVNSYVIDDIRFLDVWMPEIKNGKLTLSLKDEGIIEDLDNLIPKDYSGVQIFGVNNLETALTLISCCKFDIILLDYLLGNRDKEDTNRTYSTELFEFLSYDFSKNYDSAIVSMLKNGLIAYFEENEQGINNDIIKQYQNDKEETSKKILKEFQDIVRLNRGPLDKFWIVPMTSYNSSFISDLQSKHVKLIDHRWNISQGADPINTPWKFLYKINEFIDLQLRQSVFWEKQLLTFIQFTGEDFKERFEIWNSNNGVIPCFEVFQQFMGAEYANLMKRYGSRKLIERDAFAKGVKQSLFAKYVSKSFYNTLDNKYSIVTELNRLMQEFYHQAATMFDDRYGRQRLRESYERLRVFIAYNKLEENIQDQNKRDSLLDALKLLHTVIDCEFESKKIKDSLQ